MATPPDGQVFAVFRDNIPTDAGDVERAMPSRSPAGQKPFGAEHDRVLLGQGPSMARPAVALSHRGTRSVAQTNQGPWARCPESL